jgi:hypothetical protein
MVVVQLFWNVKFNHHILYHLIGIDIIIRLIKIVLLLIKVHTDRGNEPNSKEIKREYNVLFFSIRLNNLKETEAGFYTCEVSNTYQTLTSTGFVRVKNPGI